MRDACEMSGKDSLSRLVAEKNIRGMNRDRKRFIIYIPYIYLIYRYSDDIYTDIFYIVSVVNVETHVRTLRIRIAL